MLLLTQDYAGARAVLDAAKRTFAARSVPATPTTPVATPKPRRKGAKAGRNARSAVQPAVRAEVPGIRSANFHIVDAQTYALEGRLVEADGAYRRATALPEAPATAFLALAALEDLQGKHAGATATLDIVSRRFGERTAILARIKHYLGIGDLAAATPLVARCAAYPDLVQSCVGSLPGKGDGGADGESLFGSR